MSSSAAEKQRQAAHEKKRKEMMEDFDRQKDAIARESERNRTGSDRFVGKTDSMEENLKLQTVGLVYLEDFQQKREALEEEKRRVAARTNELKAQEPKKKKKKKPVKVKLSFEEEEEEEGETAPEAGSSGVDAPERKKQRLLGKNPNVDTSFLPDREREEKERREREELRKKWLQIQDEAKKEDIEITYSRFDGVGHRKEVVCKKGDTIGQFLERVRSQWSELRSISVDNLMYVKEDLILPHHLTFYELILNKARGKSGPLFSFDAHEDVRMVADATIEKDESHAGKVVERIWYNANKHIFPASRWETYTPGKDYGAYRVKG